MQYWYVDLGKMFLEFTSDDIKSKFSINEICFAVL